MKKSFDARLQALEARHKAIDEILRHEQMRPQPRPEWIRSLKRDKLRLKDQIESVRALVSDLGAAPLAAVAPAGRRTRT